MSVSINPSQIATPEAPWLGLRSFTEDAQDYFFGRRAELEDLYERILDKPLTILFGQSGLGKSSLLQAALIPRLRAGGFLPVLVRFNHEADASSLDQQMIEQLKEALIAAEFHEPVAALTIAMEDGATQADWDSAAFLWLLFHDPTYGFIPRPGESGASLPRPVFLVDQFEEIFTLGERPARRSVSLAFRDGLASLIENRPPASLRTRLEEDDELVERLVYQARHTRVLLSLREDFLHVLERWHRSMPSLMENRFELRMLSGPQAFEAVVRPGQLRPALPPIIPDEVGEAIVRFVAGAEDDVPLAEIDAVPPLLSLVCAELNAQRLSSGEQQITRAQFEGHSDEILQSFYLRSFDLASYGRTLDGILDGEVALNAVKRLIEDRLLSPDGYRESIAFDTIARELSTAATHSAAKAVLNEIVERRLLTVEERGGVRRLELAHDVLAPIVKASRDERHEKETLAAAEREKKRAQEETKHILLERNRFRKLALLACCLAVIALLGAILGWFGIRKAREATAVAERAKDHEIEAKKAAQEGFESAWKGLADLYESYCHGAFGAAGNISQTVRDEMRSKLRIHLLQQCRKLNASNLEHRGVGFLITKLLLDEGKFAVENKEYLRADGLLSEANRWAKAQEQIHHTTSPEEIEAYAEILLEQERSYINAKREKEAAELASAHLVEVTSLASRIPDSWRLQYLCIRIENLLNNASTNDPSKYQALSDRLQLLLPKANNHFDPVIWRFVITFNGIDPRLDSDSVSLSDITALLGYFRESVFGNATFSAEDQGKAAARFANVAQRLKPYLLRVAQRDQSAAREVVENLASLTAAIDERPFTSGQLASIQADITELRINTQPELAEKLKLTLDWQRENAKRSERADPARDRLRGQFVSYTSNTATEPQKAEILKTIGSFAEREFLLRDLRETNAILADNGIRSAISDLRTKDSKDPLLIIYDKMLDHCISLYCAASGDAKIAFFEEFTGYTSEKLNAWLASGEYAKIVSFWNAAYSAIPITISGDRNSYVDQTDKYVRALLKLGDYPRAENVLKQILEFADAILAKKPWDWYVRQNMQATCFANADLYAEKGEQQKAQALLRRAYTDRKTYGGYQIELAKYKDLPAKGVVPNGISEEDANFFRFSMKMFVIPCDVNGTKVPIQFFIASGVRGYEGLLDQFRWIKEYRGVDVPVDIQDSLRKLDNIAKENNVGFMELCIYALNYPTETKNDKKQVVEKTTPGERLQTALDGIKNAEAVYAKSATDQNKIALAGAYNAAADRGLYVQRWKDVETWARKSLELDPKNGSAYGNVATALLFQGKYGEALKIFRTHWNDRLGRRTLGEITYEDFEKLEKAGITHPDMARLRAALPAPTPRPTPSTTPSSEASGTQRKWVPSQKKGPPILPLTAEEKERFKNEEVVLLLSGFNNSGEKIYNYLKLKLEKVQSLVMAVETGGTSDLSEYGEVIASGLGEPTAEVKAEIEKKYRMINFPKDKTPTPSK